MTAHSKHRSGRRLGVQALVAAAIITAAGLPTLAYLDRESVSQLSKWGTWATIVGTVAALAALILALLDKLPGLRSKTQESTSVIADRLAGELLREQQRRLSELIGTNVPESCPVIVRFQQVSGKKRSKATNKRRILRGDVDTIATFYQEQTNGRLVIVGDPGVGKTVYALRLIVDLLKVRTQAKSESNPVRPIPVPVLASLPTWDIRQPFEEWLADTLVERFELSKDRASALVSGGYILPVLDDLDGMDPQDGDLDRSRTAINELNGYLAGTIDARVVVICRAGKRYKRLASSIRHADQILLEQLTSAAIAEYVEQHCSDPASRRDWVAVLEALQGPDGAWIGDALGTPWRLTAAMTYYRNSGQPSQLLPTPTELTSKKTTYVDRVKDLLYESFIESRTRVHKRRKYSTSFVHSNLHLISAHLKTMEHNGSSGTDITLHKWWEGEKSEDIFRHHWLIAFLLVGLFIPGSMNFPAARVGLDDWKDGLGFLASYMMYKMLIVKAVQSNKRPLVTHLPALTQPGRARRILIGGTLFTIMFGVLATAAFGPIYAILIFIAMLTTTVLIAALAPAEGIIIGPRDAIRRDFLASMSSGVAIGVMFGLIYAKMYNPLLGAGFGLANGVGWFLASASARYSLAIFMTMGVRRFGSFLNWAHSCGLLRVSGISYQFRHADLHQWLQRHAPNT